MVDKDLTKILEAIEQRGKTEEEAKEDRPLRLSSAGKKARYMWYQLNGSETKDYQTRQYLTFATGHLIHEWIQDTLLDYGDYEVIQVEGTVVDSFFGDSEGHFDVLCKDWDGKLVLIEIKTTSQFQYVRLDPKNTKGGQWFGSRNFSFDTWSLLDTPFNYAWLYQVGSYAHELIESGEEIDRVLLLAVNKNTGHIAVGAIDSDDFDDLYGLVDERVQEWDKALEAESVDELDYCWDLSDGVPLQCQYCDHIDNCLDYTVKIEKGKPTFYLNQ